MTATPPHVEARLIAYQLGACGEAERELIEGHLLGCGACLRRLFELKRALEIAAEPATRPSAQVRERLRSEVALAVGRKPRLGLRLLAAGAAVAAALTLLFWVERRTATRPRLDASISKALIDTGSASRLAQIQ